MVDKFPHMSWFEVAERMGPSTFRLYTDTSMGSGFLISLGKGAHGYLAVLATAWHVVRAAVEGTSLRICNRNGEEIVRSRGGNIAVTEIGDGWDSAVVLITSKEQLFPESLLAPVLPMEMQFRAGTEIGWLGYPAFVEPELCFFHGHIAGFLKKPRPVYLVDGVAINGVSGGPVFDDRCHLAGLVSAYVSNQVKPGLTLPGLSFMVPINLIYAWLKANLHVRDVHLDS